MQVLKDMEIGVMFWAGRDPAKTIRELKSVGARCGQIGIAGDFPLGGAAAEWKSALDAERFTVVTAFCAYKGESYADIPTVKNTVGFIPRGTRVERAGGCATIARKTNRHSLSRPDRKAPRHCSNFSSMSIGPTSESISTRPT